MRSVTKSCLWISAAAVLLMIMGGCKTTGSAVKKENNRLKRLVNDYKEENKWLAENNDKLKREKKVLQIKLAAEEEKGKKVDEYSKKLSQRVEEMRQEFKIKGISTADAVIGEGGEIIVKDILFASGKSAISKKGKEVLSKIAGILKSKGKHIQVQGHTDSDPIRKSDWSSNWHLSSVRATRVVEFLEKQGVPSEKMSVAAFSFYDPIATNKTSKGKSKNRRVEIRMFQPAEESK